MASGRKQTQRIMVNDRSPTDVQLLLPPSTLNRKVAERTDYARQCGKLMTIHTEHEFVEQDGVEFLVRIVSSLTHKDRAKQQQDRLSASGQEFNPFLPYDEDLFVADISDTHLCLLNKYNVVDHHLLIVTRDFEEQDELLNLHDFVALGACLAEIDGLAFYNGGKIAGASQRHKHLQLVPCLFPSDDCRIPIESTWADWFQLQQSSIATVPQLPFTHAITPLHLDWHDPLDAAATALQSYYELMRSVGLLSNLQLLEDTTLHSAQRHKQAGDYNLLMTRRWMFVIPRLQESFESIQVNSLGFAGALLVRNQQQMQRLKELGPMNLLRQVAMPL